MNYHTVQISALSGTTSRAPPRKRVKDYSPVNWAEYWAEKKIVGKEGDDFNCYTMGEPDAECYVKDRKVCFSYI